MKSIYVVSQDLDILLGRWMSVRYGCVSVPSLTPFRERLAQILSFGEHNVVMVSSDTLAARMRQFVDSEDWDRRPIVSVDPIYAPTELMLNVTRSCRADRSEIRDPLPRFGYPDVDQQFGLIAKVLGASMLRPIEIVLVDDVVFTGSLLEFLYRKALTVGLRLRRVIAGVAISNSECRGIAFSRLMAAAAYRFPTRLPTIPHSNIFSRLGIELTSVFNFPRFGDGSVIDEICERDFFVFSPMCGRTLASAELDAGFPYIEPYGNAASWASFGEKSREISRQLIRLNVDLLEELECYAGQQILFSHLVRQPLGVRREDVPGDRVIDHLCKELE